MKTFINGLATRIVAGGAITEAEARELTTVRGTDRYALFLAASQVKEHFVGSQVHLCSIINAKSGRCPENCAFCAQSAHHETAAPVYPLVDEEQIVRSAVQAEQQGSTCYGIVTSGTTITKGAELESICRAARRIRTETGIVPSCSLGIIDYATACALKDAGVETYHHNLETARSFFPQICSTHAYDDDIATINAVKQAGLKVCCGGIFGLGETAAQRIELAFTIGELAVDSVPLNFLNPIEGTRLAGAKLIDPLECLVTIALYRLILPDRKISVCGGREHNLRDLQSWMFFAGANGTMIGNYLTTSGRPAAADWQMLSDLDLTIVGCCAQ
jgi:biotin synthase